jgi:NADH-ubiquinone oxidoreductase chain 6
MQNIFIDILFFGTLLSGVLVITSKNPVISVIFLISVFVNAAGYLILLGIGFIGISYIIVYVGAIAVLFLFVIMMINIKLTDILETGSQYTKNIPLALAMGSLFIYELYNILPFTFNNISALSYFLEILNNLNSLFIHYNEYNLKTVVEENIYYISNIFNTINPINADVNIISFLQIESIGQSIYTYEAVLLIISSLILLLSMISPIFISKKLHK